MSNMNNNTAAANNATAAKAQGILNGSLNGLHAAVSAIPGVVKNVIQDMEDISGMNDTQVSAVVEGTFTRLSEKARAIAGEFRKVPSMKRRAEAADRAADTFESLIEQVKEEKGFKKFLPALKLVLSYLFKVAKTILKGALTVAFWAAVTGVRILCIAGQFIVKVVVAGYKNVVRPGIKKGKEVCFKLNEKIHTSSSEVEEDTEDEDE